MPNETIIVQIESDPELRKCISYLVMYEEGSTMEQIATHLGCSRSTLYEWIAVWDKAGILERARGIVLVPKAEAIAAKIDEVVTKWPQIIDRNLDIALNSKNEANAQKSAEWLRQHFVQPALELRERPGADEMQYLAINNRMPSSPLGIVSGAAEDDAKEPLRPQEIELPSNAEIDGS